MIRFYSSDLVTTGVLPPDESGHCVKVLRHRVGDEIEVVDGKGKIYRCRIKVANPRGTSVEIIGIRDIAKQWDGNIAVAIAPTKNMERIEWVVEKLVEIGVDEIIPMCCRHSERKEIKTERLERIIISAVKQSLKVHVPVLRGMTPFSKVLEETTEIDQKFIAYCDEAVGKSYLCKELRPGKDTIILIGPEGDFSNEEVAKALKCGFIPASLGECRLRTETAALVAVDTFHIINDLAKVLC